MILSLYIAQRSTKWLNFANNVWVLQSNMPFSPTVLCIYEHIYILIWKARSKSSVDFRYIYTCNFYLFIILTSQACLLKCTDVLFSVEMFSVQSGRVNNATYLQTHFSKVSHFVSDVGLHQTAWCPCSQLDTCCWTATVLMAEGKTEVVMCSELGLLGSD